MDNSLKIGIISGLVAGLIAGIVTAFIGVPLIYRLGIEYSHFPEAFFTQVVTVTIVNNLIFGVVMGAIYSKVYRLIPSKGILKGIIFCIFGYLIHHIYFAFFFMMYADTVNVISLIFTGLFLWISFGIVLGVLYDHLRNRYYPTPEAPKIKTYDTMGGIYPGAIAGFLGGVSTYFTTYILMITGQWELYPLHLIDIYFILNQFASQVLWHMMWAIFFGVVYTKVYNLVPGKGIIKGLIYGLIANFLINELRLIVWAMLFGLFEFAIRPFIIGGLYAVIYGLVLGYLYRKPSD